MNLFSKTAGFLAVLSAVSASYALTSRTSVVGNPMSRASSARMPSMTATVSGASGVSGTTTTTTSLLGNSECIDAYMACMKGGDACGENFEECTTKVLFHGKMPQCLSTLAQCNTTGINSLFGTANVTALQTVATQNSYGEVTDYVYPTDGSMLGQLIHGAKIANQYDTSTCVKRYTSCLKKDTVCGNDFELCTTDKEFRKQRVFCDSTLARCQSDGLLELFGSTNLAATPTATSRIGELIREGGDLAAINAVTTCYKVVDQCILGACAENPYKCYENSTMEIAKLADAIKKGQVEDVNALVAATTANKIASIAEMTQTTKSDIATYIRHACLDTIGSNKYCYATFLGNGQMPTSSQLRDEDNQEEVYSEAYNARMNNSLRSKIEDLIQEFDTEAKTKCNETLAACVMRVCGGGNGAACYSETFGHADKSINNSDLYDELKTGCAAVVNTDANCKYAAANPNNTGSYSYSYVNSDAFTVLFPAYKKNGADPIGAVAALNARLQNAYNDAAIANMKKRCQTVAENCVRTMCGNDYQNCYRNRNDIYSDVYNTDATKFNDSMNKMGGVLDYTIVLGLCQSTVKNSQACEEHLAIETRKQTVDLNRNKTNSWGSATSVSQGWFDSTASITASETQVPMEDENGMQVCTNPAGEQCVCDSVTEAGACETKVMIDRVTYANNKATSTIFQSLIAGLESEAQAKYKAKLTKEQNACLAQNNGGVLGKNDLGSTFMWVKLRGSKVPTNYATAGLQPNQFVASNDIFGSFCRVRVTVHSNDKKIQESLAKANNSWNVAYFATGDTFTCGSWIPDSELKAMAKSVGDDARALAESRVNKDTEAWMGLLGALGGGALGGVAGNKLADSNFLGGLMGTATSKNNSTNASSCASAGDRYFQSASQTDKQSALTKMLRAARAIDTSKNEDRDNDLKQAISTLNSAIADVNDFESSVTSQIDVLNALQNGTTQITTSSAMNVTCTVFKVNGGNVPAKTGMNAYVLAGYMTNMCKDDAVFPALRCKDGSDSNAPCKVCDASATSSVKLNNGGRVELASGYANNAQAKMGVYCPSSVTSQEVANARLNLDSYSDGASISISSVAASNAQLQQQSVAQNKQLADLLNQRAQTQTKNNKAVSDAVKDLQEKCNAYDNTTSQQKTKAITTAIGAGVGIAGGATLAVLGTRSAQKAKLNKAQQEAYDAFMESVGDHIFCVVGSDDNEIPYMESATITLDQ